MRKEPYHCPHCHQTCSRHWNMKVHIQRKHGGVGQQPIESASHSTRAEFIPGMNSLGANGRYRHHEASPDYVHLPSELYPDKLGESPPLPLSSSPSSHPAFDLLQSQNYNFPPRVDNNDNGIEQELRSQQQHPRSSFWIEEEQEHIESNCYSINIDLTKIEEKHWAYRAISEALDDGKSLIEIDSGELFDFVRTSKATFGIYVTHIGESIRHFFVYLSFKNNDM